MFQIKNKTMDVKKTSLMVFINTKCMPISMLIDWISLNRLYQLLIKDYLGSFLKKYNHNYKRCVKTFDIYNMEHRYSKYIYFIFIIYNYAI